MLGIAEGTVKVASAETYEDGRRSSVVAFALEGMEYFVDTIHGFLVLTKPTKQAKPYNWVVESSQPACFPAATRLGAALIKRQFCQF